ncbi:MAG: hypothetical protein V1659_02955 [Candidatus Woesearchaeota archaeon]
MQENNSLAQKAFAELFPGRNEEREIILKYSGKLKDYNALMRYSHGFIEFTLSNKWLDVSDEIQFGLVQSLLLRLFKEKKETFYIDLYNKFLKKVPSYSIPTKSDPVLEQSFVRVNEQYFSGMLEKTNLVWGGESFSKLGSYEYGSDTIIISSIFRSDYELLDYVMYHEMLHKKHSFQVKNGKGRYHTADFRTDEHKWHDSDVEKKLERFLKKEKFKSLFF